MDYDKIYTPAYYDLIGPGARSSAEAVLGELYQLYRPKSVVDVGCGRGNWLAAAKSLGSTALVGVDGPWIGQAELVIPEIDYFCQNLENALRLDRRADLCICVEVAEHLSEGRASSFIGDLCAISDIVLFGAAVSRQGGNGHLNEQWPSFWISLFEAHDYACCDVIRPRLWHNAKVAWWYAQNTFLFCARGTPLLNEERVRRRQVPIHDVVHPRLYELKAGVPDRARKYDRLVANPSLRFILKLIRNYIKSKVS